MFKKFLYTLFILLFIIIEPVFAGDFKINNVKTDYSENIILLNGNADSINVTYKAGFSQNPLRAYIDLDDCIFIPNKQTIEFKNNKINKVVIAQYATKPNKVRLVFYAKSIDNLKNIKLIKNGQTLTFKLNNFEFGSNAIPIIFSDVLPKEYKNKTSENISVAKFSKYIVTKVIETKAGLLITGVGNVKLSRPFILTNPIRIVFDMQNTTVQNKDLYGEYKLSNGDSIKVGQFNADTLRFVVTTDNPVLYKSFISPDAQGIFINNINDDKIGILPNTNIPSVVKKVNMNVKSANENYITLEFSQPVIHSVRRTNNKFLIDFLNVDYESNAPFIKANKTLQFGGFTTQKMTTDSDKLSVLFPVSDTLKVETGMSLDGKLIAIRLTGSLEEIKKDEQKQQITDKQTSKSTLAKPLKNKVIVIDAGHGGKDSGAVSGKMYEKDPALKMALLVQKGLEAKGAKIIMTRKDDTFVSLQDRVSISNYENADLFVSIHLNSSEKSNINGIETHWYKENSREFARCVQNHLMKNIKANDRGLFKSMFYVINHTTAPAILVETGFISNAQERTELFEDERQKATAKAIVDGIIEFVQKGQSNGK
ncbi:MAG: N-acetylmuramoyl-L-alanine amidase [Candidatus Gastranaerophilales bacterium]|nr:N-acetylmuramoyl-L-alanine amidase [Candidatus Gastranaerophilales bacterium]